MKEQNKKLVELAGFEFNDNEVARVDLIDLECFAELVRLDERLKCSEDYLADWGAAAIEAARLEEREACAKLCESLSEKWYDEGGSANDCAAAIRGRTE
jgi:hypothetical protein